MSGRQYHSSILKLIHIVEDTRTPVKVSPRNPFVSPWEFLGALGL